MAYHMNHLCAVMLAQQICDMDQNGAYEKISALQPEYRSDLATCYRRELVIPTQSQGR